MRSPSVSICDLPTLRTRAALSSVLILLTLLAGAGCGDGSDQDASDPGLGVQLPPAPTGATPPGSATGTPTGTSDGAISTMPGGSAGGAGAGADGSSMGSTDGSTDGAGAGSTDGAGADSQGSQDGQDGGASTPLEPTPGLFPPVSDFAQKGPYTSTTIANVGPSNNYTVYMPTEPAPEGAGNPLVAWTSGGGTSHAFYTLLPHLASHGFVVVTANTIPGIGAEAQLGQEILAGLDWAVAENSRAGSMLEGRIDTSMIASTGYSMGSLATFTVAADPRFITTVHISGGNMEPGKAKDLHAPAAFICGIPDPACTDLLSSACDIAGANCALDFEDAESPVFYARFEAGHLGILTSPFMERINAMTAAWLRYQLMGDTTLATRFRGDTCTYCSDPNWTIQQKLFD